MAKIKSPPHFRIPVSHRAWCDSEPNSHWFNAELSLTGVGCGLQTRRGREAQRFNSSWSAINIFLRTRMIIKHICITPPCPCFKHHN